MSEGNNQIENEEWTEVIGSKVRWLSVNWLEIWVYKNLLYMLVKRDFVTFYKQTILSPFWFIFQPIIMTLTYVIIFGNIAGSQVKEFFKNIIFKNKINNILNG